MTLCSIGAAWRLGGFEVVTKQEERKNGERHAYKRIYFLFVSGLLNLSGKEKRARVGCFILFVFFFVKKIP